MTELVLVLCGAVVKSAFTLWTGGNPLADNVSADLTDLIRGRVSNALDQRKVRSRFEKMEEIVADQILTTLKNEFRSVDEGERNAAIIAVTDTISSAKLTDKVLFAGNLDPFYLEKYVRKFTGQGTRDLSYGGTALYDRVLAQCCAYMIEIADKLPRFQAGAFAELLQRDAQILARLEDVLERLPVPAKDDAGADRVETAYRQRVVKVFDRLELFGLDFAAQWYALSIAYVNLRVSFENGSEYDQGIFQAWLAACPRLLIDGRAGSGKTTILQWIAVRAARRDFDGAASGLNGHIPFLLKLREYGESDLPKPEEFLDSVAPLLAPEDPSWPRRQLRSGRAFVLVDGIDELPEARRQDVVTWLRELTDLFPEARYVVTTRPGAIAKGTLVEMEFVSAALQAMEPPLVRTFVDRWHAAMREWQTDAQSREQLAACHEEIVRTLDSDRFLSKLADTPLLAGLICALNQHLNAQLPRRRGEIFEKALAMFYERDRTRGIAGTVKLDLAATYHLLGDLALWLVRNGSAEADVDSARQVLGRSATSLPSGPYDGNDLLRHLLLRSGLLREPAAARVDFIHRTFQEYLAAKALIASDNVGEIVRNASDDQWREVVILSAGQGNRRQTTDLLRGLLRPTWRGQQRYRRRMLAVACLDEIHGAESDVLAAVEKVIPDLLPPRSMEQAEALSHAGKRLIPILARLALPDAETELAAIVRAAALIGGPEALPLLEKIAQHKVHEPGAFTYRLDTELARSWQYFEPESYAEKVLACRGMRALDVTTPGMLRAVTKVSGIERINLSGLVTDGIDLSMLDDIGLSYIHIAGGDVRSLSGVVRKWTSVKHLSLYRIDQLEDISALPTMQNLEALDIMRCDKLKDLRPIARLANLKSVDFVGIPGLDMNVVSELPHLEEVRIWFAGSVDVSPLAGRSLRLVVSSNTQLTGVGDSFRPTIERRDVSGGLTGALVGALAGGLTRAILRLG